MVREYDNNGLQGCRPPHTCFEKNRARVGQEIQLLAPPHATIIVRQEGYGCPQIEQGGLFMPTEREKQAEKERVTRISGFRVGYHDFLAEVDLEALKRRNDR
jgi:hypothetical protein